MGTTANGTRPASQRIAIVGGGILGLTTARAVQRRLPQAAVTVLEKERALAQHQTSHNSGVVHAGVYYKPGSLKAQLCTRGVTLMRDYCHAHDLPYEECGKVIVATTPAEVVQLDVIFARGKANGVPDLTLVDADRLRQLEPHVAGLAAIHSPHTAITDFHAVATAVAAELQADGARIELGAEVLGVHQHGAEVLVTTPRGSSSFDWLVVCAGLHADRLAQMTGGEPGPAIIPFRGDYFRLRPERRHLVRGLVYPVPDPRYPFLGIHLTRVVNGDVLVGPNAALAFAREGYRLRDVAPAELARTLRWPGFRRMARQHWRTGITELRRSASRRAFVREAQRYVPALTADDVVRGPAGVRAQAVDADGTLVDDFRIARHGSVVHVRNAPSPAATSSFAIAEMITDQLLAAG